jgi:O-antigen ligase
MTSTIDASGCSLSASRRFIATFALVLPWLNPFAFGPSPSVVPWLTAIACLGLFALAVLHSSDSWTADCEMFSLHWTSLAATAWLLAGLLSTGIALLQYFEATDAFAPWVNHASAGEAFANLRQRNQFATLTNMALAALIWFANTGEFEHRATGRAWRVVVVLLCCALAVGNAASQSRTGIVQLGLVCALSAVWGLWRLSNIRSLLVAAVITYAVAAFLLPVLAGFELSAFGMAARLLEGDQLCVSRLTLWSNVLQLIAEKPWLGWGWGELDYAHYITLYTRARFCDILDNAHNLPLHLAVELGIPASLMICGAFAWWVVRQRPWQEVDPARQLAWSVLALILLHSMLEYPLWYGPFQIAFLICIALLWRSGQTFKSPPGGQIQASNSPLAGVLRTVLAMVFIVALGYAAVDYHRVSQIYLVPQERDAGYREDTLAKIRGSWLFRDQVRFAELLLTPLTRDNAQWTFDTATALLHFSPEPRVMEKVIESAVMLGDDSEALAHLARFKAAFPEEHARWARETGRQLSGLQLQR